MSVRIINADCLTALPQLAADGFRAHSVVTDPPYHLTSIVKRFGSETAAHVKPGAYGRAAAGFMGQQWDGGDVAFQPETWAAVAECMLPGAFLVAFASTRGYHRMVCAIEDAGLIIHPMLAWIFASGFPKATRFQQPELADWRYGLQALKPALEPICLAQKPLDGTGSQNWAKHGCGGLNIDASRIPAADKTPAPVGQFVGSAIGPTGLRGERDGSADALGRWPANVLHDGSPEVEEAFARFGESQSSKRGEHNTKVRPNGVAHGDMATSFYADGNTYSDTGSASRFFFCAKADASDRAGSRHPTVKPTALMRWLVQLVTPPGGTVLDPFAGTGSTGLAADQLGMNAVLIERDAKYAADAERKIKQDAPLFADVRQPTPDLDAAYQRQPGLFEAAE